MADTDNEFKVKLGRIGNRRGREAVGYVKRVRKIAAKTAVDPTHGAFGFTGSHTSRGNAQGTSRRPNGQRRVVIKARIAALRRAMQPGYSALRAAQRHHARGRSGRALWR
jgi:hypothetical protein